jgi:serine/threonine-protein kinase
MMPREDDYMRQFRLRSPLREDVARIFERAGFSITYATQSNERPQLWGYFVRPNDKLQSLLGTAQEILVWVSEFLEFQARTVTRCQDLLSLHRPRLSETMCFVLTADLETEHKVDSTAALLNTAYVGYSIRDFRSFLGKEGGDFVRDIQTRLFSKDLYFLSTAITARDAFFGRRQLLNEIQALLRPGSSHVALFGLRKMGKTSLLYRVLELLRAGGDTMVAHIDVQRIDAINPSAEYLLWSLGEQIFDSNPAVQRLGGFRLFGTKSTFSSLKRDEPVLELFDHDLRRVLLRTEQTLVILLDEVELIAHPRWGESHIRVWRLLRAFDQEFGGRLGYFITGTNPSCIEQNRLGTHDNPTYNYFDLRFLEPLSGSECSELLVKLGRPMGITWNEQAIARLVQLVGGHPFLLRSYGSYLHRATLPRRNEVAFGPDKVNAAVEAFLSSRSATFSQMIEVLRDSYPREIEMLDELAAGNIGLFREMAHSFPDDVTHLQGYGLVGDPQRSRGLAVELLQTWLQRRARARETPVGGRTGAGLSPGSTFEGYLIEEVIGNPGGFGAVYRAHDPRQSEAPKVAVKVLAGGSLSALQREVGALQSVAHANIVRFLDYGQAESGELYIVMEYLEGDTLRYFCQRGTRLAGPSLVSHAIGLAEALGALHPRQSIIDELRLRDQLSEHEYQQLEEARYGYIHRDIKPDNVVCVAGRGPVLIDFGVSVKVWDPVKTQSATPGYLPPDGVFGVWDADVDLYQLGVTLLQVALGITFSGENLVDLRQAAKEELYPGVEAVLSRLTAPRRSERYRSAEELLGDLRGIHEGGAIAREAPSG